MRPLEEILAYYFGIVKKNSKVYCLIQNRQEIKYWKGEFGLLTINQYRRFRSEYQKISSDWRKTNVPWHDSDGDEYYRALDSIKEEIWI